MHAHILFVRDNAYEVGVTVVLTQSGLTMKKYDHPWKSENVTAIKEACRAWGMAGEVYPTPERLCDVPFSSCPLPRCAVELDY